MKQFYTYKNAVALILLLASPTCLSAQKKYQNNWASIDSRPVPSWFTDAKFGIFIHWGLYSVPAWAPTDKSLPTGAKYSEWYWNQLVNDTTSVGNAFRNFHHNVYGEKFKYPDFVEGFKAELFNPKDWADLFKASGAKYVVLTSKHHEGFTLWPSEHSWNWHSQDVGPHRDLVGDLGKAVKVAGLKMGYYYSLYEWFNPLYHSDINRYVDEHMIPQMKDLVLKYKPDIVWTDGEWEHPSETWKSTKFLSWLYNDSPVKSQVVVNDRWGKDTRGKHGGFYTTEYDEKKASAETYSRHPWEECRGVGSSFGYNRAENLADYSSSEQLIHLLIEKVGSGGNLLLDIGPRADGTIPVIMQQRLTDIGTWLRINGEAIYNTQVWRQKENVQHPGIYFTQNKKDGYVLCTSLPLNDIVIKDLAVEPALSIPGSDKEIIHTYKNGVLSISVKSLKEHNNANAWVIKLSNVIK